MTLSCKHRAKHTFLILFFYIKKTFCHIYLQRYLRATERTNYILFPLRHSVAKFWFKLYQQVYFFKMFCFKMQNKAYRINNIPILIHLTFADCAKAYRDQLLLYKSRNETSSGQSGYVPQLVLIVVFNSMQCNSIRTSSIQKAELNGFESVLINSNEFDTTLKYVH